MEYRIFGRDTLDYLVPQYIKTCKTLEEATAFKEQMKLMFFDIEIREILERV